MLTVACREVDQDCDCVEDDVRYSEYFPYHCYVIYYFHYLHRENDVMSGDPLFSELSLSKLIGRY
jgi:hypothetical protein